jgi:hypothetical protein
MSERIAASEETLTRRPDGAYDFVIGRDGTVQDCIQASWSTGPSWAIWASTEQELRDFVYAWAVAGRGLHLINGLYLVHANGTEQDMDVSDVWARMQAGD